MAEGVDDASTSQPDGNAERELTGPEKAAITAAAGLVRARAERDMIVDGGVGGYEGVAAAQSNHVIALRTQADRVLSGHLDEATLLKGLDERDKPFVIRYLKRIRDEDNKPRPKRGRPSGR